LNADYDDEEDEKELEKKQSEEAIRTVRDIVGATADSSVIQQLLEQNDWDTNEVVRLLQPQEEMVVETNDTEEWIRDEEELQENPVTNTPIPIVRKPPQGINSIGDKVVVNLGLRNQTEGLFIWWQS
jgi:hypothetical protein